MKPYEKIIVALDVETEAQAMALVKKLKNKAGVFKVGKELFTACGPSIVKKIQKAGGKVFLDLKYHDIPNTVGKAVARAARLGVYMMTIHTSGGYEMMKAASDAAKKTYDEGFYPIILGVTVLTSLDDKALKEIGYKYGAEQEVLRLAKLAKKAGLCGLVCSPKEIKKVRKAVGKQMEIVTPGVRPEWSAKGDQKRVMTPAQAVKAGASYLVIGRPITAHTNPAAAAELIAKEMK